MPIERIQNYEDPVVIKAKEKSKKLIEQASFNEAIRVINLLRAEIERMKIADRFSRTQKLGQKIEGEKISSLTEEEAKRKALLAGLERIENDIRVTVINLEGIILDIEATKQESAK